MTSTLQNLGKYEIREELGRGAFATVYRALDITLNREVALKVLHPPLLTDPAFIERFQREAQTMAKLDHPHIATVYEVGQAEGRVYIALYLAQGPNLSEALARQGRFTWEQTLELLQPICAALDYAHGRSVVHRDLKPANILLDSERGPVITDFGFARLMGDSSMSLSLSGGILGTPAYIAPEVWELDAFTPQADIYALGCITYELLAGEVLFSGKTPMQAMRAHDQGPHFAGAWPADAPAGIETVLSQALARDPAARYTSGAALWHALRGLEAQAQAENEAKEQAAVAAQWQAETESALAAGEWSAAKMAAARWLALAPGNAKAQAAVQRVEIAQEEAARQQREAAAARERERLEAEKQRAAQEAAQRQAAAAAAQRQQWEVEQAAAAARERERDQAEQVMAAQPAVYAPVQQPAPRNTPKHKAFLRWTWAPLGIVGLVAIVSLIGGLWWLNNLGGRSTPTPPAVTTTPEPGPYALGDTWTRPADGMGMVYVPAGEFQMGSTEGDNDEAPVHTVALDAFWLDHTEVTNAQYQKCVAAGDCEVSRCASNSDYNGAEQPVVCVSWHDAVAYCEWAGGRLLTEAEWEYAARGPEGLIYPWGNTFDGTRLNFCDKSCTFDWANQSVDDGYEFTAPVGSYPDGASWAGALDLAGNVWEWVADWYGDYSSGRQVNPTGPQNGDCRVLRGGSWHGNENNTRGANRDRSTPTDSDNSGGFRCGVSAAPGQ